MGFPIKKNDDASILRRIITKADIMDNFEDYQKAIAFYRWYPDLFVDLLVEASGEDCTFKLYAYQRLMLRAMARYSEVNLTFSRGTSKSFTNVLFQVIKCILWPGTKGTVCAATKEQSSEILGAKLAEVLDMIPVLNFEIKKQTSKDGQIKVLFKNGSWLRNIATKGSTRGQRSTIVTTEEIKIMVPSVYKIKSNICWNPLKINQLKPVSPIVNATKVEKMIDMVYGFDLSTNNGQSAA